MTKTSLLAASAAIVLGTALAAGALTPAVAKPPKPTKIPKVLEFQTMVGLPTTYTGTQNPIRGVNGGGLPWSIGEAAGELKEDGHLEVAVSGLVFAAGPNTGRNTVASFRAIVSCLTSDGSVENVMTGLFPATTGAAAEGGGNADIEADLVLPQPCIAPIVFVTSPTGAWFATTGR